MDTESSTIIILRILPSFQTSASFAFFAAIKLAGYIWQRIRIADADNTAFFMHCESAEALVKRDISG
jgi:hypothetical protein